MNEELKAIDWLRAKTISYESRSEELHYALILYNLIMNLQKENQELKKRLAESSIINVADHKYASECEDKVITMENQQKEFIDYLKEQINECKLSGNDEDYVRADVYEEILFKIERR